MIMPSIREGLTIGIFGSNGKTSTASFLSGIFNRAGLTVDTIQSESNDVSKRIMANIETYKKLKNMENNDIIIVEISEELLKDEVLNDIDFDMLIHCHISEGSYEKSAEGISKINSLINYSKNVKTIILNTDDNNWKDILISKANIHLITYGLGSKATITASSIECDKSIKFCFCLQRALTGRRRQVIEPMEVPFTINSMGKYNIYNALAAIASALYCGVELDIIRLSFKTHIAMNGGLKILYEDGFGVIDNICANISSFESGFEAVQNLSYENMHLIFNLDMKYSDYINTKVIEIIGVWALILKITNIYFINGIGELTHQYLSKLKNLLHNTGINIVDIRGTIDEIEGIISALKDKEIILFFCSSDISYIREKIGEILDKRILGEL